jgi:hypothetical protein
LVAVALISADTVAADVLDCLLAMADCKWADVGNQTRRERASTLKSAKEKTESEDEEVEEAAEKEGKTDFNPLFRRVNDLLVDAEEIDDDEEGVEDAIPSLSTSSGCGKIAERSLPNH